MGNSNLLFESIFKRKLSAPGTRKYLTQITNEYPYFSIAQFFLLLKTEEGTTAFQQQVAKTSVLFNNPYWLQFQLQENLESTDEIAGTPVSDDNKLVVPQNQETVAPETIEPMLPRDSNGSDNIPLPETEEIVSVDETAPSFKEAFPSQPEVTALDTGTGDEAEQMRQPTVVDSPAGSPQESISGYKVEPVSSEPLISAPENNAAVTSAGIETEPVLREGPVFSPAEKESSRTIEINAAPPIENSVSNKPQNKITDTRHSVHFNDESSPLVNEAETEDGPISDQEIEPLNFKLNIDTANTTEDTITFEPLHTSDYFASLGIKLSGEIKSTDKLGKQLKSFTEWLKTMKKIHNDQLPLQSVQTDISIQNLAEQSNKKDAVVTEAMADVLLQQGKVDKAIEVYKKLSLFNPSKSAYFAAKIDQLKEH